VIDPYRIDARFGRARPNAWRSRWLVWLMLFGVAFGLMIVTSWKLFNAPLLAYGDLAAYPSDSSAFWNRFQEAWLDRGLGSPRSTSPAYLVSALLVEIFGGRPAVAQHVYIALWIPVAFLGMVAFARRWLATSWTVAVLSAAVYVTTPIAIGLQIAGSVGVIWSYAVLPFVIYSAECVKQRGARELPKLILALACFAAFSPELILLATLICLIWMLVGSDSSRWRPCFGLAVLLAWICILPAFLGRLGSEQLSERLLEKAIADAEYTYRAVKPWSIARLAGNQGDPMNALGYNAEQLWTAPGYLLVAVFVYGLVAHRVKSPVVKRLAALFACAMVSLLAYALVARTHPEAFETAPPTLLFRNPQKFSLLLAVALCAGFAYGLSVVERRFQAPRLVFPVAAALLVIGIYGSYVRPAIGGDWGVREVRGDAFDAQRNYLDAARALTSLDPRVGQDWRVVWLPLTAHDALSLEWILPRWANEPVLESTDPHAQALTDVLKSSLRPFNAELFHLAADRAAVRYIVVVRSPDGESPSSGSNEVGPEVLSALESDARLLLVHTAPGFLIWKNLSASPFVRPFTELLAVAASEEAAPVGASTGPNLLEDGHYLDSPRWSLYPANAFRVTEGPGSRSPVVQVKGDTVESWPVMSKRVPVQGGLSYELSARVGVQNATEAHAKVIWYADENDGEEQALRHDYARPALTGSQTWTNVSSGVIVAPALARFAEVQFLAGRRQDATAPSAISRISELALEYRYVGTKRSNDPRRLLAALTFADSAPSTSAIIEASELTGLMQEDPEMTSVPISVFLLNPTSSTMPRIRPLLVRAKEIRAFFEAAAAFEPVAGVWRVAQASNHMRLTAMSESAAIQLPLSLPLGLRGSITIMGCKLDQLNVSLLSLVLDRTLEFAVPERDCEPVTIPGISFLTGSVIKLAVRKGVRLDGIYVVGQPYIIRPPASDRNTTSLVGARTSSMTSDSTYRGYVLSEAYNTGWQARGERAVQFHADFTFNGFLLQSGESPPQFDYRPQRLRNALLVVSGSTWVAALATLVWFGIRKKGSRRRL
jgi:hypothetical protein